MAKINFSIRGINFTLCPQYNNLFNIVHQVIN